MEVSSSEFRHSLTYNKNRWWLYDYLHAVVEVCITLHSKELEISRVTLNVAIYKVTCPVPLVIVVCVPHGAVHPITLHKWYTYTHVLSFLLSSSADSPLEWSQEETSPITCWRLTESAAESPSLTHPTYKFPTLDASLSWKYYINVWFVHMYATQSLIISTLLSGACSSGVVSWASGRENRILHKGRIWFRWQHLDLFQNTRTFATAPFFWRLFLFLFPGLEWVTHHLLKDWTNQMQEVPRSNHASTPDTTPTKWSLCLHTVNSVR